MKISAECVYDQLLSYLWVQKVVCEMKLYGDNLPPRPICDGVVVWAGVDQKLVPGVGRRRVVREHRVEDHPVALEVGTQLDLSKSNLV